ncbi:MAG: O-antigen ligase family protein [Prevotellaceae bacterium]|jgi:hypothetical protein|nr:O-antigen ligase family protein [Prevotellaceae bacterium]
MKRLLSCSRLKDYLVYAFVGVVCFSTFVVNDAPYNWSKLLLLGAWFMIYIDMEFACRNRVTRETLVFVFICSGLAEAVWGWLQLYDLLPSRHTLFPLTGSFKNPGPYAGYLAVTFPLALYACLFYKDARKYVGVLTCLAILPLFPVSMSRASWLAAMAGSAVVLYGRYDRQVTAYIQSHRRMFRWAGVGLLGLFCAIAFCLYLLKPDSADGRLLMWKLEARTLLRHPFGVGLGNFAGAYGEVQAAYFATGGTETERYVAGNPEYAFNEYLQIGIESGLLGLGLFVAILYFCFRQMRDLHAWHLSGALASLSVFACFSYPFSIWLFLLVLLFLLAASSRMPAVEQTRSRRWKSLLLGLGCLFAIYAIKSRLWNEWEQTEGLFVRAQQHAGAGEYAESNALLKRATYISCDPMLYDVMGKNHQALGEYSEAERCFLYAADLVPNRLYPYYLLAKLYHATNESEKMRVAAQRVLTQRPKVHSRAVDEMRAEMKTLLGQ